jgi:glucose/arabinose dehydrogenase
MTRRLLALIVASLFLAACNGGDVPAQTVKSELHDFRVVVVADGLNHPWSMAFLQDGGMLVTERAGQLRLVRDGKLDPRPIAGVPDIAVGGQGGLFDVVLHPKYGSNGWIYLSYAAEGSGGINTRVTRFKYDTSGHRLTQARQIFHAAPGAYGGRHFGGRMAFDRQGYLFLTTGDRGDMPRAQRLADHSGSVIRLRDDGSVPPDNPFAGGTGSSPEIWSYGHRNPQGMDINPRTGAVWTHEHGARGGDEINIIRRGANYGWPVITHGVNYDGSRIGIGRSSPGMQQPLYFWVPSIAPSGMAFYRCDKFPKWRNSLFVGALAGNLLARIELEGDRVKSEERLLEDAVGRIRDVRTGPDGFVYLAIDDDPGKLLRLEPVE